MIYAKGNFVNLTRLKAEINRRYTYNISIENLIEIYGRYIPYNYRQVIYEKYPEKVKIEYTKEESEYITECEYIRDLLVNKNKSFAKVSKIYNITRQTIFNKYKDIIQYHYPEYISSTLIEERKKYVEERD